MPSEQGWVGSTSKDTAAKNKYLLGDDLFDDYTEITINLSKANVDKIR